MTEEQQHITTTYIALLNQQQFVEEELDYAILEKHKPLLHTLASLGNSGVSVFDSFRKEHVFYSPNFSSLLGYDLAQIEVKDHIFLDTKIHPNDLIELTRNGISLLKLFFAFSSDEKANYKLVNEYRILNAEDKYIRVVEQHQILELDAYGNMWLSLSIIDISPNQEINEGLKSQLLNFRTGKIIPFLDDELKKVEEPSVALSQREIQILHLVKDGFLSKEISDKLAISVHTVNTHRQRVLEKLGANNSLEAIVFASKLGLI
ncbi:DNA-binding CsgD family transcriptional regulator [Arcicella rosea]|uniref:LuxR C-terminal-related transcriptional regulator n=1 Tax=Arcicella rosea TaxID=502909 RepID=UPI00345D2DFE